MTTLLDTTPQTISISGAIGTSYTSPAGANRTVWLLGIHENALNSQFNSAMLMGATAMTLAASGVSRGTSGNYIYAELWKISNASIPAGAQTISGTAAGGGAADLAGIIFTTSGVSAEAVVEPFYSGGEQGNTYSAVFTSTDGDYLAAVAGASTNNPFNAWSGATELYDNVVQGAGARASCAVKSVSIGGGESISVANSNLTANAAANLLVARLYEAAGGLSFTDGPAVSGVTAAGFTAGATASANCTARLVVTDAGAAQPDDATFDASTETASATAAIPFTIPHTGETGNALRWAWVQLDDGVDRVTDYAPALLPASGWEMVLLTSLNPDPDLRLTAVPDLAPGDYVQWGDIEGTGTVVVNADASFDYDETVTAFYAAGGDLIDGWGAVGKQTTAGEPSTLAFTQQPAVYSLTAGSVRVSFIATSANAITYAAVVVPAGDPAPSAADVLGGAVSGAVASITGETAIADALTITPPLSGLAAEVAYDLYVAIEDISGQLLSTVVAFTTPESASDLIFQNDVWYTRDGVAVWPVEQPGWPGPPPFQATAPEGSILHNRVWYNRDGTPVEF